MRASPNGSTFFSHIRQTAFRGGGEEERRGGRGASLLPPLAFSRQVRPLPPPAFSDERAKSLSSSAPPPFSPFLPPGPNASSLAFSPPPPFYPPIKNFSSGPRKIPNSSFLFFPFLLRRRLYAGGAFPFLPPFLPAAVNSIPGNSSGTYTQTEGRGGIERRGGMAPRNRVAAVEKEKNRE